MINAISSILSQQWLWGAIVVGAISYFNQRGNFGLGIAEKRRVATMQLASQMRFWLVETHKILSDPDSWQPSREAMDGDPNAYYFPTPSDIPAFPFAASFDQISALKNADAEKLFRLIERRQNADSEALFTASVDDYQTASEGFHTKIARLFLAVIDVYQDLAKQIDWSPNPVSGSVVANMQKQAEDEPAPETNAEINIPQPPE